MFIDHTNIEHNIQVNVEHISNVTLQHCIALDVFLFCPEKLFYNRSNL